MSEEQIKRLLHQIYAAGFNHGINDSFDNSIGIFDAFERLILGESPLNDNVYYDIKEKVNTLLSMGNDTVKK